MKNTTTSLRRLALAGMTKADEVVAVMMVDLADIAPDPNQPRRKFDPVTLQELGAAIAKYGQEHPVLLRDNPEGSPPFLIFDGERRWRAANLRNDIPQLRAVKVDLTKEDARTLKIRQFIINDKSEGHTFEDQARLFKELLEDNSVEEIAAALEINPKRIYKVLQADSAGGLAGEAREGGLTRDPETLVAIAALEKKDPGSAAELVEKGKTTGKITRKEVRDKAATSKTERQAPAKAEPNAGSAKGQGNHAQAPGPSPVPTTKPAVPATADSSNGLPVIYVRFEGGDKMDAEFFDLQSEAAGEAHLCLTRKHEQPDHAYVAFGSDDVIEEFPLACLRFDRIVIPA